MFENLIFLYLKYCPVSNSPKNFVVYDDLEYFLQYYM
jgi:hypothetical protein